MKKIGWKKVKKEGNKEKMTEGKERRNKLNGSCCFFEMKKWTPA
jgi:hypothetical protein